MKLDPETRSDILKLAEMALAEDIGSSCLKTGFDGTTLAVVPDGVTASASFVAREQGIICGMQVCELIIDAFATDLAMESHHSDGNCVVPQQKIATLTGGARQILMIERTCLNFICRLSGISTLTHQFVSRIEGTSARIFDTRKTTPGWRRIEKYAVACGGGHNHRMGLYDAIMIKDNHLAMYGSHIGNHHLSVSEAVGMARQWVVENVDRLPQGEQTIVQIEVDTLEQLQIALESRPDIILLDNMSPESLAKAVAIRNHSNPRVQLEASGGVNLETVRAIAETGVERISIGALTHSATNFDIGLDWQVSGRSDQ